MPLSVICLSVSSSVELTREQASARFESLVPGKKETTDEKAQETAEERASEPTLVGEHGHATQAPQGEQCRDALDAYLEALIQKRKEKDAKRLIGPLTADRFVEAFQDEVEAAMDSFDEDAYWAYHRGVMAEREELKEALARNAG